MRRGGITARRARLGEDEYWRRRKWWRAALWVVAIGLIGWGMSVAYVFVLPERILNGRYQAAHLFNIFAMPFVAALVFRHEYRKMRARGRDRQPPRPPDRARKT